MIIGGRTKAKRNIKIRIAPKNTVAAAIGRENFDLSRRFTKGFKELMNIKAKKRAKRSSRICQRIIRPMRKKTVNTIVFQEISIF